MLYTSTVFHARRKVPHRHPIRALYSARPRPHQGQQLANIFSRYHTILIIIRKICIFCSIYFHHVHTCIDLNTRACYDATRACYDATPCIHVLVMMPSPLECNLSSHHQPWMFVVVPDTNMQSVLKSYAGFSIPLNWMGIVCLLAR